MANGFRHGCYVLCCQKFQIFTETAKSILNLKKFNFILFKCQFNILFEVRMLSLDLAIWKNAVPTSYIFKARDLLLGSVYRRYFTRIVTTWIGILEKRRFNFI